MATEELKKALRGKVAYLIGLITMREGLDADINEAMSQVGLGMNGAASMFQNGAVGLLPAPKRRGRPPKHLQQPGIVTVAAEPIQKNDTSSAEQRHRQSERMKKMWRTKGAAAFGEGASTKTAEKPSAKKKQYRRSQIIGNGTRCEFIFDVVASVPDHTVTTEFLRKVAGRDPAHRKLAEGGRMSVAMAEMQQKGFMKRIRGAGKVANYVLTPQAIKVHGQEQQARNQSAGAQA